MNEDDGSTKRISLDELQELQHLLDNEESSELTIPVSADDLARIDALIPKMRENTPESDELQFAMAVRQIFMAGLYALETELDD